MSVVANCRKLAADRGSRFWAARPPRPAAPPRSPRHLVTGTAAASLLAHGGLLLAIARLDPLPNFPGLTREIPVEVVAEPLAPAQDPVVAGASEKSTPPSEAARTRATRAAAGQQKSEIVQEPESESQRGRSMDAAVMAGLNPAIQTPKTGVWMPGSRPGMTARVTSNEIWYRSGNQPLPGYSPVVKPGAPPASATRFAGAPSEASRKEIAHTDGQTKVAAHGVPRQTGSNRLAAGGSLALPFGSGPDRFRAVAVPLPSQSGGEAMSYRYIVGGMLERVKHYPESALQRGAKGIATIGFVLDQSGGVESVSLLRSSGKADLDAESVAVVDRAAPFPPPPLGANRSFAIEVAFGMRS